jgi:hypothetical protein
MNFLKLALCSLTLPVAVVTLAQTELKVGESNTTRWVHGSWVNVRSEASKTSKIKGNWTTNTKITLIRKAGDWCQVSGDDGLNGFIACDLVGSMPLTLKMISEIENKDTQLRALPERKFWVAPSAQRLAAVGWHLNGAALSEAQRKKESETKIPIRFLIPEFEAMKARLTAGFIPNIEQELPRINLWLENDKKDKTIAALQVLNSSNYLPPIKPSLFTRQTDVVSFYESTVDSLVAMTNSKPAIQYLGKPRWATFSRNEDGIASYWDIGRIKVTFAEPLVFHSIGRNGLVSARSITSQSINSDSSSGCDTGYPPLPDGKAINGYPKQKEWPLLSFYSTTAVTQKKVLIESRKKRFISISNSDSDRKQNGGERSPSSVAVHSIDLNADGIADFAIIESARVGEISGQFVSVRHYFTNIQGIWFTTGEETTQECT